MQLMLEDLAEQVRLPEEDELRKRLNVVFVSKEAREKFVPRLLEHAGEGMNVSAVPSIIIGAIRAQIAEDDEDNIRYFVAHHVPQIIDAMVPDLAMRDKAAEFLLGALNG